MKKQLLFLLFIVVPSLHGMDNGHVGALVKVNESFPSWEIDGVESLRQQCFKVVRNNHNRPYIMSNFPSLPSELQDEYQFYAEQMDAREQNLDPLLRIVCKGYDEQCVWDHNPGGCTHKKNLSLYVGAVNKVVRSLHYVSAPNNEPTVFHTLLANLNAHLGITQKQAERDELCAAMSLVIQRCMSSVAVQWPLLQNHLENVLRDLHSFDKYPFDYERKNALRDMESAVLQGYIGNFRRNFTHLNDKAPLYFYTMLAKLHAHFRATEVGADQDLLHSAANFVMRKLMIKHSGKNFKKEFKHLDPSWEDLLQFSLPKKGVSDMVEFS